MSCSKPLPPFVCDSLYYLNRDQLERFSIVYRPLKNFIERYFHAKPCRVFDELGIRGGSYILEHKCVQWHPNRGDYSAQQFLAGQRYTIGEEYYSFAEMRPYLGPTIQIKETTICVAGSITYNTEHISEMESIVHLWRYHKINIIYADDLSVRIAAEDFPLVLNSPTILQCRELFMINAHFSFKDYSVLYTVRVLCVFDLGDDINCWQQFLEQSGIKPVVVFYHSTSQNIGNLLDQLSEAFFSAVSTNAFKIVFVRCAELLTECRKTNTTSGEKLELKKGLPVEWQKEYLEKYHNYTLERSSI